MKPTFKALLRLGASFILMLPVLVSTAQTKLGGSYVATSVSFLSDDELPDNNILKYTYVKYTFIGPDQISTSGVYYEKGTPYRYTIQGNRLIIKSEVGAVINTMKIMESTPDKLILVSGAANGSLEDPWAIKYTLYKEERIQEQLPLSPDDIFSIKGQDTVYKSGQKIYAQFQGPSFQSYIYGLLSKKKKEVKSGQLRSTFIINEQGQPDSLRIIQGINPRFDAQYIKAFNTSKNMWQAAQYNGKSVKVRMEQELQYLSSEETIPAYFDYQKANAAYSDKDYELALYYFDSVLETRPEDVESLYRRGICKQMLGNLKGACADWSKIQLTGSHTADELLLKYCK